MVKLFGGFGFQDAPTDLIFLDRLEQGTEIPLSEALITLSLDEFEKNRTDHGF